MITERRQLDIVHPRCAEHDERTYIVARCPYTLGRGCYMQPRVDTTYICRETICWQIGELYATYLAEQGYWAHNLVPPDDLAK